MFRRAFFVALAVTACGIANAQSHTVKGYVKKDGTYVSPSRATNPNRSRLDNYSTKGNVNPYSGKVGTKSPTKPR